MRTLGSAQAAERLGVSRRTFQRWTKEGPPKTRRIELSSVVLAPEEVLGALALRYHHAARRAGHIKPPNDAPGWDKGGRQETWRYEGGVKNVRLRGGLLVGPNTEEELFHKVSKAAETLSRKQKKGKFFLTLTMVEHGKEVMGSPGKQLYRQPKRGTAVYQSFEGIRGADSIAGLVVQLEELLHRLGHTAGSRAVVDSFTVKRYEEKDGR